MLLDFDINLIIYGETHISKKSENTIKFSKNLGKREV